MKVLKSQIFWAAAFLLLFFGNAASQDSRTSDKKDTSEVSNLNASTIENTNLIHFGDLVDVDVMGFTEFDWRGTVTSDGFLGGLSFTEDPVYALCRRTSDVAAEIQEAYGKFLNKPVVNVQILDKSDRPLAILYGAVRQPLRFRLMRRVSLKELIVLAGGFSENASGVIEIVSRPLTSYKVQPDHNSPEIESLQNPEPADKTGFLKINIVELLSGKAEADPIIKYGDIITVQTANPVYVIGDVANPGRFAFSDGLTVSRAISAAGGMSGKNGEAEIRVFRRNQGGTSVIELASDTSDEKEVGTFKLVEYDIVEVSGDRGNRVRYPPVLKNAEFENRPEQDLPVRVVD